MNKCKIKKLGESQIELSGVIDEFAEFDLLLEDESPRPLRLDLRGLMRINSSGLRILLQSLAKLKGELVMHHCSVAMTDQFSLIPGMIGPDRRVESCYIQYSCEDCDHEEKKLVHIQEFVEGNLAELAPDKLPCPSCGNEVEIDHDLDIYFSFVNQGPQAS